MSEKANKIPFHVEMNRIIELLAKQIYQSPLALLRENTQNAYDATLLRRPLDPTFKPKIDIVITPDRIVISDNGIGMTPEELEKHYWRAGSSGKNNDAARAAGVVGTFGIGAMANFGTASRLEVITESARTGQRTLSRAARETLSATEDCIDVIPQESTTSPGTTVTAYMYNDAKVNVNEAVNYIRGFVQYLTTPVVVNGKLVSQVPIEKGVPQPAPDVEKSYPEYQLLPSLQADITLSVSKSGEVWVRLASLRGKHGPIDGVLILRQGGHQIQTLRSLFALAGAGVNSAYRFGGVANLPILQPTAGREAITTESLQLLQTAVTAVDNFVSQEIAGLPHADVNTDFMNWAWRNQRIDLCGNLRVQLTPGNQSMTLAELRERTAAAPINYYDGNDSSIIEAYGSHETPLLVAARSNPRKNCEQGYIRAYCNVNAVSNQPTVLERVPEAQWTLPQSALAFRIVSILENDYFLPARVSFGRISHNLHIFVDSSPATVEVVINPKWGTILTILGLYDSEFGSFGGLVKDFIRTVIFPKVGHLVPSSTRQGAAAFLKSIRKQHETFELGSSDLGSLGEIWSEYVEGRISLAEAAKASTTVARASVQVVDRAHTLNVSQIAPDVIENQRLLEEAGETPDPEALPAITRVDKPTTAKLLLIGDGEPPLKGYRCFLALTERARSERGDFFLQPHWTEVVWGGQKVLYIFQHHSRQFGFYYELQTADLVSEAPGRQLFPTCTMLLGDTVFIPVPEEIAKTFIPGDNTKKRFEVRYDLLYPEAPLPQREGD